MVVPVACALSMDLRKLLQASSFVRKQAKAYSPRLQAEKLLRCLDEKEIRVPGWQKDEAFQGWHVFKV